MRRPDNIEDKPKGIETVQTAEELFEFFAAVRRRFAGDEQVLAGIDWTENTARGILSNRTHLVDLTDTDKARLGNQQGVFAAIRRILDDSS